MSKTNKILLVLVIILFLVLVGLVVWQRFGGVLTQPSYWAVYLRTGDLYFGKLTTFPSFSLKNVYTLQVNQQNQENPVSIQRFVNVFWGPQDFLKINRSEVVWMTKLDPSGQLAELLKTNPTLKTSPTNPSTPPTPSQNADTGNNTRGDSGSNQD